MANFASLRTQLEATERYLKSLQGLDVFEDTAHEQGAHIRGAILRVQALTLEEKADLTGALSGMSWPRVVLDNLLRAVASTQNSVGDDTGEAKSTRCQNYKALHGYFTKDEQQRLRSKDITDEEKSHIILHRMRSLGCKNASEDTFATATAILLVAAKEEPLAVPPQQKKQMFDFMRDTFRSMVANASPDFYLRTLPSSPNDLPLEIFQKNYPSSPPQAFLVNSFVLQQVNASVPQRWTSRQLAQLSGTSDGASLLQELVCAIGGLIGLQRETPRGRGVPITYLGSARPKALPLATSRRAVTFDFGAGAASPDFLALPDTVGGSHANPLLDNVGGDPANSLKPDAAAGKLTLQDVVEELDKPGESKVGKAGGSKEEDEAGESKAGEPRMDKAGESKMAKAGDGDAGAGDAAAGQEPLKRLGRPSVLDALKADAKALLQRPTLKRPAAAAAPEPGGGKPAAAAAPELSLQPDGGKRAAAAAPKRASGKKAKTSSSSPPSSSSLSHDHVRPPCPAANSKPISYRGAKIYMSKPRMTFRIIRAPPNYATEVSVAWGGSRPTPSTWHDALRKVDEWHEA